MALVENRLSARIPVALKAWLELDTGSTTSIRVRNFSPYGAYARVPVPVPRHRRVWVHLRPPGRRGYGAVQARVVRADGFGIGLEFDDYGNQTASLISDLLARVTEPARFLGALRSHSR